MKIIKRIKSSKVLQNISWIIAGRIVYMVLNFIVSIISARYLGPSNFGLLGYAAAYTTFFASICNLGIDSIIIKELINHKEKQGTVLGTSMVLKMISSLISLLIITCLTFIIDHGEPITKAVVIIYTIHILFNVFTTMKFWFQARLQSKDKEIAVTIAYFVMSAYKIYLLVANKSVLWFALSNTIELIVVGTILFILYRKNDGDRFSFSWKDGKRILNSSKHFIFSGLMVALYNATDRFMLKQILDSAEVSYYQAAITISSISTFLLIAIIESVTPVITEAHKNNEKLFIKRNIQLYAAIFYISVFVSLIITLFAKPIILILYGESYIRSVMPLSILTWYTAFSYLGVARNPWIVCEDKQKYLVYIYIGCALCNVVLNYYLIPSLGASGASIASLITQFSTIFIFPLFFTDLRKNVKLILNGIMLRGIK